LTGQIISQHTRRLASQQYQRTMLLDIPRFTDPRCIPLVGTQAANTCELQLTIKRKSRKSLAIHVLSGSDIEVRVPLKCPWSEVDRFIEEKLQWMLRTRDELARRPKIASLRYVQNATHSYLGEARQLELVRGKPAFVAEEGASILVRCLHPDREALVQKHVESWLAREGERRLPSRLELLNHRFGDGLRHGSLRLRKMKSRWGSCDRKGEICINSLIMRKHPQAIDLVLMHELCHLRYFAHDASFYGLMDKVMPDWRDREQYLLADAI
jgi:predicted metal-dependent hydrolase